MRIAVIGSGGVGGYYGGMLARAGDDVTMIAQHMEQRLVRPGEHVTREGASGYFFFVILDGTASVERHGELLAELGPGDFFGEIGLLRTHFRTADVIADTDMKVVVIFGPEFVVLDDEIKEMRDAVEAAIAERMPAGQA